MMLSIVIVNWNTRDLLDKCLESVYTNSPSCPFEIWLVDNHSSDSSIEMVREKYPNVRLIVNHENIGFAHGNNQAIREARGKYVLLLNPDTEVFPGAFDTLIRFLEIHPEAGGAGSRLISPDGSLQNSCNPDLSLPRELWRLFHLDRVYAYARYDMNDWDLTQPRTVDSLQGACLALRKEALDAVGLLDEEYFMYTEEVDLCYRMRKAGWLLYWVPESVVMHYGGQSTKQVPETMFLRLYQSRLQYFRKHHGSTSAQGYKAVLLAASLARLGLSPLSYIINPSEREKNRALASHYTRLLASLPKM